MALQTFTDKIKAAKAAYDDAVAALGRDAIAPALAEHIPQGFALTWTQYTPSFNDGDPCTFRLGEVCLVTLKEVLEPSDEGADVRLGTKNRNLSRLRDEDDEGYFSIEYGVKDVPWAGLTKKAVDDLKKVWKLLDKTVLERAFGNGARVAITCDGKVVVDDYDCGY